MNNNQRYGVLQLFAPEGAENAQTGDSTADAGQRAAADGEEFETLIKGRFKEPFAKKTQAIIDKRFREFKSLESYRDRVRPLIGDLLARYDLQEGDEETLAELLRDETPAGADVPTEPTDPDGDGGERRDALLEALHDWAGQESALRELYPDVPIVIGGIEASMRRLTHYDYWQDKLMPSILVDSGADLLVYGMGEQAMTEIADRMADANDNDLHSIPQTAYLTSDKSALPKDAILLASHEEALRDKRKHAENFRLMEIESNKIHQTTLVQPVGKQFVVVNPSYPPLTTAQLDAIYDLPYQYTPHPKYKDKRIPAYEMIKWSVCMHRGCFGGCSFCTISAHQGKQVVSRSKASILRQIERLSQLPDWHGVLSDLGGPSANMYGMHGKDMSLCEKCARASCLQPTICKNLNQDFAPLLDIYRTVDKLPYVNHAFVGSGIRYDLMSDEYARQLITRHVSGRLKVAPEHCSDAVLKIMRKPAWSNYLRFRELFLRINREAGLNQQLIPYFISSHPACTKHDMMALAEETKRMHYRPEQVQDFTPTPMTLSTTMFYTGINPYTGEPVYVARTTEEKKQQNQYFFWYKKPSLNRQSSNRQSYNRK